MVPFTLEYGKTTDSTTRTKIISYAELRKSRSGKRSYVNVYDTDYQAYNQDISPEALDNRLNWAIPAILSREIDWGDLEVYEDELVKGWHKNHGLLSGIKLVTKTAHGKIGDSNWSSFSQHWEFDPAIITVEQVNLWLKPIKGKIVLGPGWY